MKKIFKYIKVFIWVFGICLLSMYVVCSFSSKYIKTSLQESLECIEKNLNDKEVIVLFHKKIMLDTCADAMMLNTAYCIESDYPFYSLLFARSNYVAGVSTETVQNNDQNYPQIMDLRKVLQGEKLVAIEYARYWHGYLVYLRPLLCFFNYMEIKELTGILHLLLLGILLYQIKKKIGMKYLVAVLFGIIAVDGYLAFLCLEASIGINIILIESILFLSGKKKKGGRYFFIIGMLTAFFDLLTLPVAICMFPLLLYVLTEKEDFKELLYSCIKYIVLFGIGYLSMWVSKWILVDAIYDGGIVKNAISQIFYRTGTYNIDMISPISFNFRSLGNVVSLFVVLLYMISTIVLIVISLKEKKLSLENKKNFLVLALGLAPMVWFGIMREHSLTHAYFTYRNLMITCICVQVVCIHLLERLFPKNRKYIFTIFILLDSMIVMLNYLF